MKKRLLSLALCLALCLGLLPVGVLAEEGGGIYIPSTGTGGGVYEPTGGKTGTEIPENTGVTYIGADGSEHTCETFTELTEAPDSLPEGWYVVKGKVDVTRHNLFASGTVNLILCDGAELNLSLGLHVYGNAVLNIYGQSGGTGKLIATGENGYTAIGIVPNTGNASGTIHIYGGTITAQAHFGAQAIGKSLNNQHQLMDGYLEVQLAQSMKCVKTDEPDQPCSWENTDGTSVTISKCTDHKYRYQIDGEYHFKRCDLCGTVAPDGESQLHSYENWTPAKDGVNHIGTCVCGATTTKAHTLAIQPNADGLTHSQTCSECGYKSESERHRFVEEDIYGYKWQRCSCGALLAAEYNSEQYGSLQAAVDAASAHGDTVTLAQNVPESVTISGGNVTIDLNGHDWGSSDTYNDTLTVTGGSVTLQNGTLSRNGSRALFLSGGEVKIGENMTLWGHYGSVSTNPAIAVQNTEAKLTLGKDTKLIYGMKVPEGKTLSDYLLNGAMFVKCNFDDNSNLTITDEFVPNAYTINEYIDHIAIVEHTHSFDDNDYICSCGAKAVASVTKSDNVTYYTDLAEAIANADGGTVILLNDVTATKYLRAYNTTFTLDLNGKTITANPQNGETVLLGVSGTSDVTIRDSVGTGKILQSSSSTKYYMITLYDGKLTILGGYFQNRSSLGTVLTASGGCLNIKDGTFVTRSVWVYTGCDCSISGGNFTSLYATNSTVSSLLEDGYSIKNNGIWLTPTELSNYKVGTESGTDTPLTVEKAPIKSVILSTNKTTVEYGQSQTVQLSAGCEFTASDGTPSYQWYEIKNGEETTSSLQGMAPALPEDLPVGDYTYRLTVTRDGYSKSCDITIKVTPVDLSNATIDVTHLTYNGSEQAPEIKLNVQELALTSGTDYTITGDTSGTNAGTYKLTITGQGNYTGTKTVEWKILPKTIANPTIEVGSGGIYDKTAKTPSVVVKDDGTSIPDSEYTVSYENNTNAGTATVKITDKENGNYTVNCSSTFEIQKAPALILETINVTATAGVAKTITVPLTGLMPEDANISGYVTGTMNGFALVSGDNIEPHFIYDVTEDSTKGTITATVTIKSQNYEDSTATVSLTLTPKAIPVGAPTLSKSVLTYGDKLGDITLSGSMMDREAAVEGTFSWASPEDKPSTTEKYVAKWVFTPKDKNTYATVHGETNITVNKATPTGKPEYTAITTSGKKLSDASLTQTETSFSVPGTVAWNLPADTEVTANTAYEWVFTPNDTDNYNSLTGTITLWHKSSSGSSSGSVTPGTKTDTVKNPDGSTTKTETKADGSKTETTTASSGGGSTGTTVTKTDAKGNTTTEASAKLSDRDVKEAQEKGEAVTVPVKGIAAAKDANAATKIKIDVPNNANKTTVEIPVENVTSGTVAVIVHPDGTEEIVKDSIPTESGVQLELSGSTTVKIIDNSKTFDDTKGHWSRDDVNFVAARDLFQGVGGNRFGVSEPMTRGMVNTVLARLAGVDTTPSQGQAWYEVGTDWAKKNGISDGTNPTAPVTREQLATLLYRYAGSPSVSGTLHAADAASVSDYAEDALLWANQNGIVNGVGSNTIAPKDNAQRAQVAAMLARYLQNQ